MSKGWWGGLHPHCLHHLIQQTLPSCSNHMGTRVLDHEDRLPFGPQLFILSHSHTFCPRALQFLPLRGQSTFHHPLALDLAIKISCIIGQKGWRASSKTSCAISNAMKSVPRQAHCSQKEGKGHVEQSCLGQASWVSPAKISQLLEPELNRCVLLYATENLWLSDVQLTTTHSTYCTFLYLVTQRAVRYFFVSVSRREWPDLVTENIGSPVTFEF